MNYKFHAKTLKGLENVLARELTNIGASDVTAVNRGVNFSGSISMMYKANLYLRTALRILMPVYSFRAKDDKHLYNQMMKYDWSQHMTYKHSFAIDAVTFSDTFRNNHYVELKTKDAIVDQFRNSTSLRPSVNKDNPDIRINVHVNGESVLVSLDSSGESLHKRGYRKHLHIASLSEVLAAGMVLLTGWDGEKPLQIPMCGSGTIAIEGAMIAAGILPGHLGRKYAFENWIEFDDSLFERIKEAMPSISRPKYTISASDIDPQAIRITKANVRSAGLEDVIDVKKSDFIQDNVSTDGTTIILNPPYGERIDPGDLDVLYGEMGTRLKHHFQGSEAWIFSSNDDALKQIGLKPEKKYTLYNGKLECRYLKYRLFSGKHKNFKAQN